MKHVKPRALRQGDTIGIAAPASNVRAEFLEAGIRELQGLGFKTVCSSGILDIHRYLAGTDDRRSAEFVKLLRDPGVQAIFCARGGYGSGRIVPALDGGELQSARKIVLGSSDLTILLSHMDRSGAVSFHGPMVATAIRQGPDGYDRQLLFDLLAGGRVRFPIDDVRVLQPGVARSSIVGGCLSLITATIGTPFEIQTDGRILLIEDVDTKPYQIDRMLTHLRQAGKLDGATGFIFGEMQGCIQSPDQGYSLEDVVMDRLGGDGRPILFGFPTGHTSRPQLTVPFGVPVILDAGTTASLELAEPAVDDSR